MKRFFAAFYNKSIIKKNKIIAPKNVIWKIVIKKDDFYLFFYVSNKRPYKMIKIKYFGGQATTICNLNYSVIIYI